MRTSSDGSDDLEKAKAGDGDALVRLLARNEERLRRVAEARLTPRMRARLRTSDILQSTFLRVVRSIDGFEGRDEEQFSGWVVRILENTVRDERKHELRDKRRDGEALPPAADEPIDVRTLKGRARAASGPLRIADEFRLLNVALTAIKGEYRQVLLLRMVDGKSHREIAATLGKSEAAVRVLFARARAAFLAATDRLRGPVNDDGA